MVKKIQDLLARIDTNQSWLVGVSGGRDSVVLLDVLVQAGLTNLVVVHVNHQLRAEASDGDAEFVEQLAQKHGLAFYSDAVDVIAMAESEKKGLELAAREARHGVFVRALEKYSAAGILLGHHADDQAETVLFNLLRGSNGLKGIRVENIVTVDECVLRIVRPLLEVRRSEINDYVKSHGIEYREDTSNAEAFTARNRIRHEVMPLLVEIMRREVVPAVNGAAEVSMEQSDYLDSEVVLEQFLDPQGRLFLPALHELDLVLQQAVMFQFLKAKQVPDLSRSLIVECLVVCDTGEAAKCNLPGGRWLRRKEQRVFIQE
ncbi:MAG: tRNA(Ile)-lysidine synthase [Crocinitomicaceae bacterium]